MSFACITGSAPVDASTKACALEHGFDVFFSLWAAEFLFKVQTPTLQKSVLVNVLMSFGRKWNSRAVEEK